MTGARVFSKSHLTAMLVAALGITGSVAPGSAESQTEAVAGPVAGVHTSISADTIDTASTDTAVSVDAKDPATDAGKLVAGNDSSASSTQAPSAAQNKSSQELGDENPAVNENPHEDALQSQVNDKTLAAYRDAIKVLDENGPYFAQSSETLYGLGIELQKRGYHEQALDTLGRAMHVNRVNNGLHSFSQAPMLSSIITSHKALNQFEDVTVDYYRLLNLHLRTLDPADPALLAVRNELALWHVDAYQMDNSSARVDHLTSAQSLINAAIDGLPPHPDTQASIKLLRTAALVSFYFSQHEGDDWTSAIDSQYSASADKVHYLAPVRTATLSSTSYRQGRHAHEQIIALTEADPNATDEQKISAYVEAADWQLMFKHTDQAMAYYQQAQALIAKTDRQQALTDAWFAEPEVLPALRTENSNQDIARLDIIAQLDVSKTGSPSRIKILDPPAEKNRSLRRAAMKAIKNSRFRPRFVNGEPVSTPGSVIKIPMIH